MLDPRGLALERAERSGDGRTSAIAYALLYVGDQLSEVTAVLHQLDVTVNNGLVGIENELGS
jgi:hypothetical protein